MIQKNLIVFTSKTYLKLYNIDGEGAEIKILKGHKERIQVLYHFTSNTKHYLLSSGWDRMLNIWSINEDLKSSELLISVIAFDSLIKNLLIIDNLVIVYGLDKKGNIWKMNLLEKKLDFYKDFQMESMNVQLAYINNLNFGVNKKRIILSMSDGVNLSNYKLELI